MKNKIIDLLYSVLEYIFYYGFITVFVITLGVLLRYLNGSNFSDEQIIRALYMLLTYLFLAWVYIAFRNKRDKNKGDV